MAKERIDKLVSNQLALSRDTARRMIRSGRVSVNGAPIRDCARKTDPETDKIAVDSEILSYSKYVYVMMNKPAGVISASKGNHYKTVIDILPEEMKRKNLFPAGRLDKDTTGFLLITDDGAFAHQILSPGKHVDKTYAALLDKPAGDAVTRAFETGITLADGTTFQPASLTRIDREGLHVRVVIHEGKYHQIKRMFLSQGITVLGLHREKIGLLALDPALAPGECRYLTTAEQALLTPGKTPDFSQKSTVKNNEKTD